MMNTKIVLEKWPSTEKKVSIFKTIANKIQQHSSKIILTSLFPILACKPLTTEAQTNTKEPKSIRVTVVAPDDSGYWTHFRDFTNEVAHDLGIEVSFIEGVSGFQVLKEIKDIQKHQDKTDYLITFYISDIGAEILKEAESAGVKTLVINSDLTPKDKKLTGKPREKFTHWLGHIYPNDVQVGYDLADKLINIQKRKYILENTPNKDINIIAIGGPADASVGSQRETGLKKRINEDNHVHLKRIIRTQWEVSHAEYAVKELLDNYPDINAIWAANDFLAMAASRASRKKNRIPGKDIIIGGIDWTEEAVMAVENGELAATFGGHYLIGGWALVLILDYHYGQDFVNELGTEIRLPLNEITKENSMTFLSSIAEDRWTLVDYRAFSKHFNPELKHYDFSAYKILEYIEATRKTTPQKNSETTEAPAIHAVSVTQ